MAGLATSGYISGQVIDWSTKQPIPEIEVFRRYPNSEQAVARTDARGSFRYQPTGAPDFYFLFAKGPRYGLLLQERFGAMVIKYRPSQTIRNVVIPAIPATTVGGHVTGEDGKPIAGCDVSILISTSLFQVSADRTAPINADELRDSEDLEEVGLRTTDRDGTFSFSELGADRYFVRTRCDENREKREAAIFKWRSVLYPDSNTLSQAQPVVVLPGDRRTDVNFHLRRVRTYRLEGMFRFEHDHRPKDWPTVVYSQKLEVFRPGLETEACQVDSYVYRFWCDSLSPGDYRLQLRVGAGLGEEREFIDQAAEVQFTVAPAMKQPLTVQLHSIGPGKKRPDRRSEAQVGKLSFQNIRAPATEGVPAISILLRGRTRVSRECCFLPSLAGTTFEVTAESYTVSAYQAAFRSSARLRNAEGYSKIEQIAIREGSRLDIHPGRTTAPSIPFLTTAQLIDYALRSFREDR